jgi:hypothetical protein
VLVFVFVRVRVRVCVCACAAARPHPARATCATRREQPSSVLRAARGACWLLTNVCTYRVLCCAVLCGCRRGPPAGRALPCAADASAAARLRRAAARSLLAVRDRPASSAGRERAKWEPAKWERAKWEREPTKWERAKRERAKRERAKWERAEWEPAGWNGRGLADGTVCRTVACRALSQAAPCPASRP